MSFQLSYQSAVAFIGDRYRVNIIVHRTSPKKTYVGSDYFCFEGLLEDRKTGEIIADYTGQLLSDSVCFAEADAELLGLLKDLQHRVDRLHPTENNDFTIAQNFYHEIIDDARGGWEN